MANSERRKQTLNVQRPTLNAQFSRAVTLSRPFDSLRSLRAGYDGEGPNPLARRHAIQPHTLAAFTRRRVTLAKLDVGR
jgi:hypothetical protein